MKRIIVLILVLIINMTNLHAQKIGAIFIGSNNYIASAEENLYNVNEIGFCIGWLIPINIDRIDVFYKVNASHHTIKEYYSDNYERELDYFFSATNEILIGKRIKLNDKIDLLPQIGFGAIGEAIYFDWDKGVTHGEAYMDISMISSYKMKHLSFGLMINFEKDLIPASKSLISDKRLNVSLLVLK